MEALWSGRTPARRRIGPQTPDYSARTRRKPVEQSTGASSGSGLTVAPAEPQSEAAGRGHRDGYRGLRLGLSVLRIGPLLILIVLVVALSFLSPFFLTTRNIGNVLAAVRGDRGPGAGTAAGDPDPRDRPVGRLDARARDGHRRARSSPASPPVPWSILAMLADRAARRRRQRHRLRQGPAAASVHHHARDAEHRPRASRCGCRAASRSRACRPIVDAIGGGS